MEGGAGERRGERGVRPCGLRLLTALAYFVSYTVFRVITVASVICNNASLLAEQARCKTVHLSRSDCTTHITPCPIARWNKAATGLSVRGYSENICILLNYPHSCLTAKWGLHTLLNKAGRENRQTERHTYTGDIGLGSPSPDRRTAFVIQWDCAELYRVTQNSGTVPSDRYRLVDRDITPWCHCSGVLSWRQRMELE